MAKKQPEIYMACIRAEIAECREERAKEKHPQACGECNKLEFLLARITELEAENNRLYCSKPFERLGD